MKVKVYDVENESKKYIFIKDVFLGLRNIKIVLSCKTYNKQQYKIYVLNRLNVNN